MKLVLIYLIGSLIVGLIFIGAAMLAMRWLKKRNKVYPCDSCQHLIRKQENEYAAKGYYWYCGRTAYTDKTQYPPEYCKYHKERMPERQDKNIQKE